MAEVEVKISTMVEGSEQLRTSSQRLLVALRRVEGIVDDLIAVGFESPAQQQFVAQYHTQRTVMNDLPLQLLQFAGHLEQAVEDLQQALNGQLPVSPAPIVVALPADDPVDTVLAPALSTLPLITSTFYGYSGRHRAKAPLAPKPATHSLRAYVNSANRPLYDLWQLKDKELKALNADLETYQRQHTNKTEELTALTNRIMSANPQADINQVPKIRSLRQEIVVLEQNMATTEGKIQSLQAVVNKLESRLSLVKPAPGADLSLIAQMEHADTPKIVLENTHDCVRYVVGKFAIPPNMATNAYLWNDNVKQMPAYGITSGQTPLQGSVLVMEREHAYASDIYGHVAYVERVDADGTIWITDNIHPDAPVKLSDITTEISGDNMTYLYFPWHTKA